MRTQDFCTFDGVSALCPLSTPGLCQVVISSPAFLLVEISSICCSKFKTISIYSSKFSPPLNHAHYSSHFLMTKRCLLLISLSVTTSTPHLGTKPWKQVCNKYWLLGVNKVCPITSFYIFLLFWHAYFSQFNIGEIRIHLIIIDML